jgi:hypothetical protein
MKVYVPDESLVVFDLIPPRQYLGANAYRKDWADFLAIFSGPPKFDITDVSIAAEGNLGFSHSVERVRGTDTKGQPVRIFDLNHFTAHSGTADDRPWPRTDRRSALMFQIRLIEAVARRKAVTPPSNRKITDTSARHSCDAVSTTLCRIDCSSNLDRLIALRTSSSPSPDCAPPSVHG